MTVRTGDIWQEATSIVSIEYAYKRSIQGKSSRKEVMEIEKNRCSRMLDIQSMLRNKTYEPSEYRIFQIHENGKTRDVADVQFYPDRIIHWVAVHAIESRIMSNLIDQTYAAIPGRGSHRSIAALKNYLHNDPKIRFCLKMDVRKYFANIDKTILKSKLRHIIKDNDMLWLLDKIVDSYPQPGIPIGNLTSQYFANYYLSEIDHTMKETYHCHYYLRYMDDIIILGYSKPWLHRIRNVIAEMMSEIGLEMKSNWQIFPVDDRGIDFVGYRTFSDHILLRTSTKVRMKRAISAISKRLDAGNSLTAHDKGVIASYNGVLSWCDSYHLYNSTIAKVEVSL